MGFRGRQSGLDLHKYQSFHNYFTLLLTSAKKLYFESTLECFVSIKSLRFLVRKVFNFKSPGQSRLVWLEFGKTQKSSIFFPERKIRITSCVRIKDWLITRKFFQKSWIWNSYTLYIPSRLKDSVMRYSLFEHISTENNPVLIIPLETR